MKKVTKAVIPAAGLGTRVLPATKAMPKGMLPIVDKPAIQYLVEEAVRSGITDILIILGRNQSIIEDHFDRSPELEEKLAAPGKEKMLEECLGIANMANIYFVRQKQTLGLGHAVSVAKAFTGDDPFVVIYGDDVIWGEDPVCAQLIRAYEEFGRPCAGVSAVPWADVSRYCSLKTTPIHDNYFFVDDMIEKPKKGQEFSNYSILGRVLLTPEIYDILANTKPGAGGEIQLTDAMAEYARNHGGLTAEILLFSVCFVVIALITKIIGCGLAAKLCRFNWGDSLKVGVGMMTRGEVALIVAQKGLEVGVVDPVYFTAVILLIVVSSVLTPLVLKALFTKMPPQPHPSQA